MQQYFLSYLKVFICYYVGAENWNRFSFTPGPINGRNRMYRYPLGRSDQLPLQFKSIKVKATLFTIYIYIYMYIYVCTKTIKCLETHHVRLLKRSEPIFTRLNRRFG